MKGVLQGEWRREKVKDGGEEITEYFWEDINAQEFQAGQTQKLTCISEKYTVF